MLWYDKPITCRRCHIVKELVCWATGKRLTDRLPQTKPYNIKVLGLVPEPFVKVLLILPWAILLRYRKALWLHTGKGCDRFFIALVFSHKGKFANAEQGVFF